MWKDEWTQALFKEVTKLDDLGTWVRVPADRASGYHVHRCTGLFKNKLTDKKELDRRKVCIVVQGMNMQQYVDYLEHFAAG